MAIEVKNLSKEFKNQKALKGITITFKENTITGLIGFNGSGKTTTFNIMANFIENYGGEVYFDGQKANQDILSTISYLAAGSEPKNPIKVMSHFLSIAFMYNIPKKAAITRIKELAEQVELTPFLNKSIKALSKGNQQKLKVVSALLNPRLKYLFLDEPFDGLDPIMVKKIQKIFMNLKNVTTIITSHQMDVVQAMCEEFYVLKEGVLVESKQNKDLTVLMIVNQEVDVTKIAKMKGVIEVKTKGEVTSILIEGIEYFKPVNEVLIKDKKYLYSSLKEKNLAEAVFERYGDE